jgi:hypothetical protein
MSKTLINLDNQAKAKVFSFGANGENALVTLNAAATGTTVLDVKGTVSVGGNVLIAVAPSADSHAVNKLFVDTAINTINSNATTLAGRVTAAEGEIDALQGDVLNITGTTLVAMQSEIDTLESNLSTEVSNRTTADTSIRTDFAAADTTIRTDFAAADAATLVSAKTYTDAEITANVTNKLAVASGIATLDGGAKILMSQLPDSIIGQVEYQGVYDMSSNVEPAVASSGNTGHYYVISVAGSRAGFTGVDGDDNEFNVGDWIISNGSTWDKVDNTDAVATVFGRNGNIQAVAGDYTASQVTFVPAGSVEAIQVQAAIEEVSAEVATEKTRAELAEATNATAISNEKLRAEGVEADLLTGITANATAISSEEDRAIAAEAALQNAIDNAVATAKITKKLAFSTAGRVITITEEFVAGSQMVYLNGLLMSDDANDDYAVAGQVATFNYDLESGDKILVFGAI